MNQYTVSFYLSDDQQRKLEHMTALFNTVYAGQVEPYSPAKLFESIALDSLQARMDAWEDLLRMKAAKAPHGDD